MATHKVGGEVDAFCTRCKMTLAHTILAMVGTKIVRVKCNTCGGDHAYRSAPGTSGTAAPRKPRASAGEGKVVLGWTQRMAERDASTAKKYSVKETFAVDDMIDHPTFGLGFVSAVRGDKVDVAFKTEQKTLMHGRASGVTQEKPKYAPPSSARMGPADKPVAEGGEEASPSQAEAPSANEEAAE